MSYCLMADGTGALKHQETRLKVLLMSGYPIEPESFEKSGLEHARFLRKPFAPEALPAHIRELIGPRALAVNQ
jgi:DNA-binding NtrC family response regulator